ncbi:amidase domain-containing protein [Alloscardovia macacae]|nr:amidase domain-containing protein [Alloscardovia macacae]
MTISAVIAILSLSIPYAHAVEPPWSASTQPDESLVSHYVSFGNRTFALLDTYKDPDSVRAYYSDHFETVLSDIARENSLSTLAEDTASLYKDYVRQYDNLSEDAKSSLLNFLDYYENKAENTFISQNLDLIYRDFSDGTITEGQAVDQALLLLPYKEENHNTQPRFPDRNSGINLEAAKSYARTYATTTNGFYGRYKADCTNFASQILRAGGVQMTNHSDERYGWWFKSHGNRSISWINADTFTKYMGSGYQVKDWNAFVVYILPGDFIGYDDGNDGKVDHVAFVYDKSGNSVQIAQHSSDYLKWNGGWPGMSHKAKFYRIRR